MKNWFRKINNQGSTLLTVIICLAFIGILGSMMLSVTLTNLQMKIVESRSKKNFYSCEMTMEEIRVAVQEISSEAVKYIYETDVLGNYAYYLGLEEGPRNIEIQQKVVLQIIKNLGVTTGYNDAAILAATDINLILDCFNGYLSDTTNTKVSTTESTSNNMPLIISENVGTSIRIKGIKIEYEKDDYRTAIVSDIIIKMPEFSFKADTWTEETHYSLEQPFQKYVLVAEGAIKSANLNGTTDIIGSVYAGVEGIQIDGKYSGYYQVNINGENIVTRGDITVSDTAKLTIGYTTPTVIWANNLVTKTSNDYSSMTTQPTNLNIKGICIIKDDLVLDGLNSNVNLQGAYIGYTGTHSSLGSAMMINGSGSALNLAGLSDLVLAGRAHVSVKDVSTDSDILTGESIAFKSNQRAYLLPEKFIVNVLHNPVTEADYSSTNIPDIIIDDSTEAIKYNDYVSTIPYKIAAKQTGSTTLRYYYLFFGSGKQADAFTKEFMNLYPDTMNRMEPFTLGNVVLPGIGIGSVVGNSMSYDADVVKEVEFREGLSSSITYADDASLDNYISSLTLSDSLYNLTPLMGKSVGSLSSMYSRINHLLTLDNSVLYDETKDVMDPVLITHGVYTIIDNSTINISTSIFNDFVRLRGNDTISTNDSNNSFHVIDGDVTINTGALGTKFSGILIANGNITIGDNVTINGMIITTDDDNTGTGTITVGNNVKVNGRLVAAGDIILGQECILTINDTIETELASIFTAEGDILRYLFNNSEMTVHFELNEPASSLVDLTSMISYENWRKVE